ncbi:MULTISPECIES: hypothetical protein [unclassified Shewanella]|uniref:hypothetical protein n=1 Tax=unclassified Shewanella TaxID=196818 RepID=UPI001BB8DB3E|nr:MULTISPECIES: hypothetical protein [unclassified Shewanella]GIU05279.1 hypothetical protein TUM4444_01370 [Shewanella sp. MBTL60-112-B1]GIU24180.1 hypothetical protein TUM4445_01000 [Shewanella sp. MBTL60-112-B2]
MLAAALSPLILVIVLWCNLGYELLTGQQITWYEWSIVGAATLGYGGYYLYGFFGKD